MGKVEVTKSKPLEITTRVNAYGRLYKNLQSGKIILEVFVDGDLFHDKIIEDDGWLNWANKKLEENG